MICPRCLEEYELLEFDVDAETLEHRGIFRCDCGDIVIFPEHITRELVEDRDTIERMRLSRMLYLNKSFEKSRKANGRAAREAITLNSRHLERYIQDLSEHSARNLK